MGVRASMPFADFEARRYAGFLQDVRKVHAAWASMLWRWRGA